LTADLEGHRPDVDDHEAYRHDAAVYHSPEEFLAVALPFVRDGLAAGEPVLVALPPALAELVVGALPDGHDGVSVVPYDDLYRRPARGVQALERLLTSQTIPDAGHVRVLGATPLPAARTSWQPWARFEAYLTSSLAASPAWLLCLFDGQVASPEVLDDVRRTHPHLVDPTTGRRTNPTWEMGASFLRDSMSREEPEDTTAPAVTVTDPSPHDVRRLVATAAAGTRLSESDRLDLVTAASEIATNAHQHGRPPVVVRIWSEDDLLTVRVRDAGIGPDDPSVGLAGVDRAPGAGGMGLWLANLLCSEVTMRVDPEGFEVRLTARADAADR
jgi:anti-sigma regulatory factor (Ser/Thr protein kinase)